MSDNENDDSFNEEDEEYDEKIKIMIIGETKIGKSSLIARYCNNSFSGGAYLSTIGIDFQIKNIEMNGKKIRLQIWDTAGQERFRNIAKNYFQSSNGFIVVYDITCKDSFDKLTYWIGEINENAPVETKTILLGNKIDLKDSREVPKEEGEEFSKSKNINFLEVSAKDGTNVKEAFDLLIADILKNNKNINNRKKIGSRVLKPINIKKQKKKSCC